MSPIWLISHNWRKTSSKVWKGKVPQKSVSNYTNTKNSTEYGFWGFAFYDFWSTCLLLSDSHFTQTHSFLSFLLLLSFSNTNTQYCTHTYICRHILNVLYGRFFHSLSLSHFFLFSLFFFIINPTSFWFCSISSCGDPSANRHPFLINPTWNKNTMIDPLHNDF